MPRESAKWAKGSIGSHGFRPNVPKDRLQRYVSHLVDLDEPLAYRRDVAADGNRAKVVLTIRNRGELECPNCGQEDHILMENLTECMDCGKRYKPEGYDGPPSASD